MTSTKQLERVNGVTAKADRMQPIVELFTADRACLERLMPVPYSARRWDRFKLFYEEWRRTLREIPFETLSAADRADWRLLWSLIETDERHLEAERRLFEQVECVLPFATSLVRLDEDRRAMKTVDAKAAAIVLDAACEQVAQTRAALKIGALEVDARTASLAARAGTRLGKVVKEWFDFYSSYDPLFGWWADSPYHALDTALTEYAVFLRHDVAGASDEDIVGHPVGRDGIEAELRHAHVPYTPEELIEIGQKELEWCRHELRLAARELGHGDDWRAALEQVKRDHSAPGDQPALVRELAWEAIHYVEDNDLVTVPPLARECWRMEMMSAEDQKVNPFFLGGESIIVSFPTREMQHAQKQMSLRGNNRAFARATVHHELIPGHHLQMFSQDRYRPYRQIFYTPFWTEGWTLHWEMLLWERKFARTPQERIGMLFWRMHRGARVVFSLEYHLGLKTEQECIDMLVLEAGHERDNAIAEVRRSFEGGYHPLYQCAYLIGGFQMHALYHELVTGGRMTARQFHDAVMHENCMPIPILRSLLSGEKIEREGYSQWRFSAASSHSL